MLSGHMGGAGREGEEEEMRVGMNAEGKGKEE